jgi:hypothetical protein
MYSRNIIDAMTEEEYEEHLAKGRASNNRYLAEQAVEKAAQLQDVIRDAKEEDDEDDEDVEDDDDAVSNLALDIE